MFYEVRVIIHAVNKMKEKKREGWEVMSICGLPTKVVFQFVYKRSEEGLRRPPGDIKPTQI